MDHRLEAVLIVIILISGIPFIGNTAGIEISSNDTSTELNGSNNSLIPNNRLLKTQNIAFTENRGQLENDNVRYYDQGGNVWFTDSGVFFKIQDEIVWSGSGSEPMRSGLIKSQDYINRNYVVLKQEFIGSNNIRPEGIGQSNSYSNYFYGQDPLKWQTEVPSYDEVYYQNLYNGIDLRYYSSNNGLKYDFIVHPGAEVNDIRISYDGIQKIETDDQGNMMIETTFGTLKDSALFIYQSQSGENDVVEGTFLPYSTNEYGFVITEEYDETRDLIIDPNLIFSTFVGGNDFDEAEDIYLDPSGDILITGNTASSNFPNTPGVYQTSKNGNNDVFVTKLNEKGSKLKYSTFVGGSNADYGFSIAVDPSGNAYVTGQTYSSNFPTISGSFDTGFGGGSDAFILKLNSTGTSLFYSTFLGASGSDYGYDIAVDTSGNAYITGRGYSGYPTTTGAYDTNYGGWGDAIITKINPRGTSLVYSTYIGAGSWDWGNSIAIDNSGNAYIAGATWSSSSFPTTSGAYDTSYNSGQDGFMVKLNALGQGLSYGTYIGGGDTDYGNGVAVDDSGDIYVAGRTESSDFPVSQDAYNSSSNGGIDLYVLKIDPNGTGQNDLIYSTYVGGNDDDYGYDLGVDSIGNTIVTGRTRSTNFPTTIDAFDKSHNGGWDAFMFQLDNNGSSIIYSTYVGSNGNEECHGVIADNSYNIYLTGFTASSNFPDTPGVYDRTHNGQNDVFVMKFGAILNITSTTLLLDQTYTQKIYSNYSAYTFRVNLTDSAAITDLGIVQLTLDPEGENIQMQWDRASDQFVEINDPQNYVSLNSSSSSDYEPVLKKWKIEFDITFNWTYPDEEINDVNVFVTSAILPFKWLNLSSFYQVENDLTFNGELILTGEDDREIIENTLVRGGEDLNLTGLTAVYQGTTNIYPLDNEFNITVIGETGSPWNTSPKAGEPLFTRITVPEITNSVGYNYQINITEIPPECDVSDVSFTITIDADNIKFSDPKPNDSTWQTTLNTKVGITIEDTGGALVNGKSAKLSVSNNNGNTWSMWNDVQKVQSKLRLSVTDRATFAEGTDNLIKWRAEDTIGNGPTESEGYRVLVDTEVVSFKDPIPDNNYISKTELVSIGVTIFDETSGVDPSTIEIAVSYDEGITWSNWLQVVGSGSGLEVNPSINLTFPNGTQNRVKWRGHDIAGNGPMESGYFTVKINTWVPPVKPKVKLISPENSVSINNTTVELFWELENESISNVTYEVLFDTLTPPRTIRYKIQDTTVKFDNLEDGQIYYWQIMSFTPEPGSKTKSETWFFKIELIKKEIVFKLDLIGLDSLSMFPGESKEIPLTVTNLGNEQDFVKLKLEKGDLAVYSKLNEYTLMDLGIKKSKNRSLIISLPASAKPGIFEINITAISMNSDESVYAEHQIIVEVKDSTSPEPRDIKTSSTDWLWLLWIIIIVIILSILIAFFVIRKRRKDREAALQSTAPMTYIVKPGTILAPTITLDQVGGVEKSVELSGSVVGTNQPSIASATPQPIPQLAKATVTATATTQAAPSVAPGYYGTPGSIQATAPPQLPQLPPARTATMTPGPTVAPTVASTTQTPTLITPPPEPFQPPSPGQPQPKPQPQAQPQVQPQPKFADDPSFPPSQTTGPNVHLPSTQTRSKGDTEIIKMLDELKAKGLLTDSEYALKLRNLKK